MLSAEIKIAMLCRAAGTDDLRLILRMIELGADPFDLVIPLRRARHLNPKLATAPILLDTHECVYYGYDDEEYPIKLNLSITALTSAS